MVLADLVVEVISPDSRTRDSRDKLHEYEKGGVPEYWIADLENEQLLIYRDPEGALYRTAEVRQGDEVVSPLAAPEFSFTVRQAFD